MGWTEVRGLKPAQGPEFDSQGIEMSSRGFKQGGDVMVPILQEDPQGSHTEERFKVCRKGARL